MQRNELCYDCVDLLDSYGLSHSTFCRNCSSSAYLFDCIGCKNCISCIGLRNKEYCIFNVFIGKEAFEKAWEELFNGSYETRHTAEKEWKKFEVSQPHRAVHNTNAPDSTGDYLVNCDQAKHCYKCLELRDSTYCQYVVLQCNDLSDVSAFGESLEFSYELSACGGIVGKTGMSNCCFDAYLYYGGNNVYYSINILDNSKDIFGCCDLRTKSHCILNKQYTKEEYETLVQKIITHMRSTGEWGEFFPLESSPFCYNETLALDYFPLAKEQAAERGLAWKDTDPKQYQPATFIPPDNVRDIPDGITKELLACTECRKNYRVIPQELDFYRTQQFPIPRLCTDCRYLGRIARRNPQKLWNRTCKKCNEAIVTSYAPDRPEIVYCERCYLDTIY